MSSEAAQVQDLVTPTQLSSLTPCIVEPRVSQTRRPISVPHVNRVVPRSSRRSHRSQSSNGRSRSRHRHHIPQRCRTLFKHKERNFAAASCSMVVIVLLCTGLVPHWIHMTGGSCHLLHKSHGSLHQLSTAEFFYNGHFYKHYPLTNEDDSIYQFGSSSNNILVNCVTYPVVLLFKAVIAFTLIAVFCSLIAFFLDLIGPSNSLLKSVRRNAIFNIVTVVLCGTVTLLSYWITTGVERLQENSRLQTGSKVSVTFHMGFYLITAAGAVSVIATACNCLRRQKDYNTSSRHRDRYIYDRERERHRDHDHDDIEALLAVPLSCEELVLPSSFPNMPPPEYTP